MKVLNVLASPKGYYLALIYAERCGKTGWYLCSFSLGDLPLCVLSIIHYDGSSGSFPFFILLWFAILVMTAMPKASQPYSFGRLSILWLSITGRASVLAEAPNVSLSWLKKNLRKDVNYQKMKSGPTRIRTGVVRIRTESDNHYTIGP